MTVYWTTFHYNTWKFYAAATEKGLCYLGPRHLAVNEMEIFLHKQLPNKEVKENENMLHPYMLELQEYLEGKRQKFELDVDLYGTAFQQKVWQALQQIPFGKTVTYSDIAESIEKPQAVRAVGAAIGANPIFIIVPCHRVIGKNGALTGFRGGLDMKKRLLLFEKAKET
ncbi:MULTISPECIES: methylated-DNA--[protein]-cysteine S-methyltransferase [Clostridia]|uniref:methylated-DNA--[protein]-cysteine S-methyltransferase n=1 Tax=Clostridia TaxID=186801 RepID=UPI000EA4094F|nr:methylated-DNA--[protein]-cysteine S-methyltransferase [Clostridium sp. 1xD42-85]NBJ70359.1 methylated-DNA--[protein]-cysteine S-methyltransferase [Roseburia sp. 1XD42-34]RKI76356.1 methylated-DNA--[protein]-cysteine S-methyltransferase [Clostridium sp. 1xD42-85]